MKFSRFAILILFAAVISCVAVDITQTTVRYRYGSVLTFDPTIRFKAEDGTWTNTPAQFGYLSKVTSDIQTQLNAKTGTNSLPVGWTQKTNTIIYVSGETLDTNTMILTQTLETNTIIYVGK